MNRIFQPKIKVINHPMCKMPLNIIEGEKGRSPGVKHCPEIP